MIEQLIVLIKHSRRQYDCVVGIANGGLNVSKPVAQALEVPHFTCRISCYDGEVKRMKPIIQDSEIPANQKNMLIVDDLVDEGHTLRLFDEVYGLKCNNTAVLFWNPQASYKPQFYIAEKPKAWLVFPWEEIQHA